MAYDALKRGRDILIAAIDADFSGYLAAVNTSYSGTAPANRAVYRAEEARPMFPNIEVSPPRGTLTSLSHGAISTTADYWIIANLSNANPLTLDDWCMAYCTALVRLACELDSDDGDYLVEPVEFDFSPPVFTDDTQQKRSVGVLCRLTMAESV